MLALCTSLLFTLFIKLNLLISSSASFYLSALFFSIKSLNVITTIEFSLSFYYSSLKIDSDSFFYPIKSLNVWALLWFDSAMLTEDLLVKVGSPDNFSTELLLILLRKFLNYSDCEYSPLETFLDTIVVFSLKFPILMRELSWSGLLWPWKLF